MDGINGITALTMILWGSVAALTGLIYSAAGLAFLGVAAAGSALGFIPWNSPRARIFLGDSGSYLFGALAAAGLLMGAIDRVSLAVICAPFSVYVADVSITLARRALRGERLFEAHRQHIYQRLVHGMGMSHLAVALWATSISGSIVIVCSVAKPWIALVLTAVALVLYACSVSAAQRMMVRTFSPAGGPVSRGEATK